MLVDLIKFDLITPSESDNVFDKNKLKPSENTSTYLNALFKFIVKNFFELVSFLHHIRISNEDYNIETEKANFR
jgi:hypothetical protein